MVAWLLMVWTLVLGGVAHAQDGVLQIQSNVQGATVHVNYEEAGETPLTRYVEPGRYTIRVTADGYDPYVRQVVVSSGNTTPVKASLSRGGGTADLVTTPGGAHVEINGQDTGLITPTRLTNLQDGTYLYRLVKEGYEPIEGSFQVQQRSNPLVSGELKSSRGLFVVTTRPAGADVYLDGELVGQSPLELENVPPGEHSVGLVMAGYALAVRTVDTSDGSKGEVDTKLKEEGSRVIIKTGHPGAAVSLNGVPVGTGKTVKLVAGRGSYDLKVEVAGGQTVADEIKVPLDGAVLYEADPTTGELSQGKPLTQRWTFWTGVGVGAVAVAGGSVGLVAALRPDPPPSGDVVLTLP